MSGKKRKSGVKGSSSKVSRSKGQTKSAETKVSKKSSNKPEAAKAKPSSNKPRAEAKPNRKVVKQKNKKNLTRTKSSTKPIKKAIKQSSKKVIVKRKTKQSRLEYSKHPKKLPVRKKMPKNRWVDGERDPIVYTCGRCKKTVELFLPAKVLCSKCGNVMKTVSESP